MNNGVLDKIEEIPARNPLTRRPKSVK